MYDEVYRSSTWCDGVDQVNELFAEHGRVDELEIDDAFFDHMRERATYAKHLVTVAEVLESPRRPTKVLPQPGPTVCRHRYVGLYSGGRDIGITGSANGPNSDGRAN